MAAPLPLLLQLLPLIPSNTTQSQMVGSFRLEKAFFERASGEVKDIINYEVLGMPIKPQCMDILKGLVGTVCIKWMTVIGVEAPNVNFEITEKGFRWRSGQRSNSRFREGEGSVKVEGAVNFTTLFFHKTGKVLIAARKIKSDVRATIVNHRGRPEIVLDTCKVKIGNVEILKIDAGFTGWILSQFSVVIEFFLEIILQKNARKAIKKSINKTNNFIKALPDDIPVWGNVSVRYNLSKSPRFRDGAVEVTSSFNFSSNDLDDDEDCGFEEKFSELNLGKDHSPFSNPFEYITIADLPLIALACVGVSLLILDKKYVFITVLGCILVIAILLLLLPVIL